MISVRIETLKFIVFLLVNLKLEVLPHSKWIEANEWRYYFPVRNNEIITKKNCHSYPSHSGLSTCYINTSYLKPVCLNACRDSIKSKANYPCAKWNCGKMLSLFSFLYDSGSQTCAVDVLIHVRALGLCLRSAGCLFELPTFRCILLVLRHYWRPIPSGTWIISSIRREQIAAAGICKSFLNHSVRGVFGCTQDAPLKSNLSLSSFCHFIFFKLSQITHLEWNV